MSEKFMIAFIGFERAPLTARTDALFVAPTREELEVLSLNEAPLTSRYLRYDERITKKLKACAPGALYEVSHGDTPTQMSYTTGQLPWGCLDNDPRLAEWRAAYWAVKHAQTAERSLERAIKERTDLDALAPLRRAYVKLSGSARAQLIADVVQYISR